VPAMVARFMATDRGFAKARRTSLSNSSDMQRTGAERSQ